MDLVEVIAGNGPPPSLVLELVHFLPPGSACEAVKKKTPAMVGYDMAARILLDVSDWSQATMITAGSWAKPKDAPKFQPAIRPWDPKTQKKAEKPQISLNDLSRMLTAKSGARG